MSLADLANLRWFYLATTLFYLGATIAFFVVYGVNSDTQNAQGFTVLTTSTPTGYQAWGALTVNPTLFAALAATVALVGGVYDQITWSCFKPSSMSGRTNWTRWVADSLVFPLLYVTVVNMLGVADILLLLCIFGLQHVSVITGALVEGVNSNVRDGVCWWPIILNFWFGLLSQLPFFIYLANSSTISSWPVFAVASYSLLVICWFLSSILQVMYYTSVGNVTDKDLERMTSGSGNAVDSVASFFRGKYLGYDSLMGLLTAIVKVVVIAVVALAYNGSTTFLTNHYNANVANVYSN